MNALELKTHLTQSLFTNSGLERHRHYLGMSSIGRCPLQLYTHYLHGRPADELDDQHHWRCWLGYLFEAGVYQLAGDLVRARHAPVVAPYDDRFRGHIDYHTADGDLVEIKTVSWDGYNHVRQRGPKHAHAAQVQMYLRHGSYPRAFIIYVARDTPWRDQGFTPPFWVFEERPRDKWADSLDAKARRILAAIDARQPPRCTCGRCSNH